MISLTISNGLKQSFSRKCLLNYSRVTITLPSHHEFSLRRNKSSSKSSSNNNNKNNTKNSEMVDTAISNEKVDLDVIDSQLNKSHINNSSSREAFESKPKGNQRYGPGGRHSRTGLNIAIFGATGFVGRYVVNALGRHGNTIFPATRGDDFSLRHLKPLTDYGMLVPRFCELRDETSIMNAMKGCDVVINLIGKHYDTKNFPPTKVNYTIEQSNKESAYIIARAARRSGISHLVHISCLSANGQARSRLAKAKLEGEKLVSEQFPGASIIRPAIMYGEEDRLLNFYAPIAASSPVIPLIEGGKAKMYPVWVNDVAEAISLVATNMNETAGETIELPGKDSMSRKEVAEYVSRTILRTCSFADLPTNVAKMIGKGIELLPNPFFTQDIVDQLQDVEIIDPSRPSWGFLGMSPADFEHKAINHLYRFRKGGHFREIRAQEEDTKNHHHHHHHHHSSSN